MGWIAAAVAVGAAASTSATVYQSVTASNNAKDALSQQKDAQASALKSANTQQKAAEENINRQNSKSADVGAITAASEQAAKGGAAGTMLTGSQGVDPTGLALGKNTLLGS